MILSKEERQQYIDYMLENKDMDETLQRWNKAKDEVIETFDVTKKLLEKCKVNRGLIVAIECQEMESDVDNIKLYIFRDDLPDEKFLMNMAVNKDGKKYLTVFTTKERFREFTQKNDGIMGILMFVDDIFRFVLLQDKVDGIVLNLAEEEVMFDKDVLKLVLEIFDEMKKKEKC